MFDEKAPRRSATKSWFCWSLRVSSFLKSWDTLHLTPHPVNHRNFGGWFGRLPVFVYHQKTKQMFFLMWKLIYRRLDIFRRILHLRCFLFWGTPWKINMEPEKSPVWKGKYSEPNHHGFRFYVNLPGCILHIYFESYCKCLCHISYTLPF